MLATHRSTILLHSRFQYKLLYPHLRSKPLTKRSTTTSQSSSSSPSPSPKKYNESIQAFGIGSIAGVMGSLAGMGGGFVMIPLMTSPSLLGLSQHVAHGTSLCAVAATGMAGAWSYSQNNSIDLESALTISACAMLTARLGANAMVHVSEKRLKQCLGGFMIAVAPIVPAKPYLQSWNKGRDGEDTKEEDDKDYLQRAKVGMIGLGSGFLAGLLGVGGGAVVVPALTVLTSMDHYTALGTSLCAMCAPAVVGSWTHFQKGNVASRRIAPALVLGSFVGSYLGGRIGVGLKEEYLRYGFSGLMVTLGVKTIAKA